MLRNNGHKFEANRTKPKVVDGRKDKKQAKPVDKKKPSTTSSQSKHAAAITAIKKELAAIKKSLDGIKKKKAKIREQAKAIKAKYF